MCSLKIIKNNSLKWIYLTCIIDYEHYSQNNGQYLDSNDSLNTLIYSQFLYVINLLKKFFLVVLQ